MTIYSRLVIASAIALTTPVAAFALAVSVDTSASAGVSAGAKVEAVAQKNGAVAQADVKIDARMQKARAHGDQEIDRRITALTDLSNSINAMVKISSDNKASLTANIQSQITDLTNLKTKIDADDAATLKVDVPSITQGYRIYMLVMPQGRITAAADKVQYSASLATDLAAKLQARISAAQASGQNVDALSKSLTDMNAKVADANTQASASVSAVASLSPDNGDQAKMTANTKALSDARAKIKIAMQDLQAARKDITSILKGLKVSANVSASATTTATN